MCGFSIRGQYSHLRLLIDLGSLADNSIGYHGQQKCMGIWVQQIHHPMGRQVGIHTPHHD